jgi:hypothetical protein
MESTYPAHKEDVLKRNSGKEFFIKTYMLCNKSVIR